MRLQSDLQRVQELNAVMKDQVDILQSQLLAPSEHQILIAQLFTQSTYLAFEYSLSVAFPTKHFLLPNRQRVECGQRATGY